ncbi:MAG: hypothetical protein AABX51_08325, partial [Nanoarchaeota archaeon]
MARIKWLMAAAALLLLILPAPAFAQSSGNIFGSNINSDFGIFSPLGSIISPIINLFVQAGNLEGENLIGFTRFIIWIVVFAVIYGGLKVAGGQAGWIKNNIAVVLALCFSIISAIFTPDEWILQIGSSWAQVGFLLMIAPILAVILVFAVTQWNKPLLSAPLWFVALALISYFNQLLGIERPQGNTVPIPGLENSTGIMHVIFQVLGTVASIAFIIQLVRAILGMFSGGNLQGGGPNIRGWFGGQQNHDDRPERPATDQQTHDRSQRDENGRDRRDDGAAARGQSPAEPLEVHIRGPANGHHVHQNTPVRFIVEVTGGQFNIEVAGRVEHGAQRQGFSHHVVHNEQQRTFDAHHTFQQPGNYLVHFVATD